MRLGRTLEPVGGRSAARIQDDGNSHQDGYWGQWRIEGTLRTWSTCRLGGRRDQRAGAGKEGPRRGGGSWLTRGRADRSR